MQETQERLRCLCQDDSPGEGNGNWIQYSCLENSMDRGAWWATVHGVTKSQQNWVTEHQTLYFPLTSSCITQLLINHKISLKSTYFQISFLNSPLTQEVASHVLGFLILSFLALWLINYFVKCYFCFFSWDHVDFFLAFCSCRILLWSVFMCLSLSLHFENKSSLVIVCIVPLMYCWVWFANVEDFCILHIHKGCCYIVSCLVVSLLSG